MYMIAFVVHDDGQRFFKNKEHHSPINNMSDVQKIEEQLTRYYGAHFVTITGWYKFG